MKKKKNGYEINCDEHIFVTQNTALKTFIWDKKKKIILMKFYFVMNTNLRWHCFTVINFVKNLKKNQIVTKLKKSNCDNTKCPNWYKILELKLW